ncbi:hypothetical protein ACQKMD_21285 [Viridibacillus sp. NPDC096237]|uniref:hypothetical protein n=1 Tax=Viridibacillus sp. NPDC096237 TaxID=3390721 RepID=UPI003CFFB970
MEMNQVEVVVDESSISLQIVYDWVKGERKVSNELTTRLSQTPQFKGLIKENINEIDIQLAYYEYRSSIDSYVEYDAYGLPKVIDPHEDEIRVLLEIKNREQEINDASGFLYGTNGGNYLNALHSLNSIFSQENTSKKTRGN